MEPKMTAVRERIISATATLLAQGGREAASTRAVAAAAGIQAPTLYRQFGDLQGLLDEVARTTFAAYVHAKSTQPETDDPVAELRRGWDTHIAFGLAHPAVYALIYENPAVGTRSPAAEAGHAVLTQLVTRVAQAGRLQVGIPRAVQMIAAAGEGVTLTLIRSAPERRDSRLSSSMREAVLAAVLTPEQAATRPRLTAQDRTTAHAIALRAGLTDQQTALSGAERQLLAEWLDRLIAAAPAG
ncbi:TetR/AcrR family transcriptional regulator [Deinococcus sp. HMF7604]|uniref:TetR/AcrR family transcriptional regulator n=1 Tax=Deinococcus betulae TaxID=2873312 RepID=UPI001CCF319D|nr:TetR/AcrR family transcriptional regulator [Deinococcus betulae]MBZ9749542.1 TetR/AcrR family transcriptional regulator [Deinococcus betulae]